MNLITAKSLSEIGLKGVKVDWKKVDAGVQAVTITDEDGRSVVIQRTSSYAETIAVLVPEPPKMEKRFVLEADVAGINVRKAFTNERDADRARADLSMRGDTATVTETEVPVIDGEPVIADDEIAF